jgi:non-haem Fe2+, alpha-ketoglutarate-dependent halogenase
MPRALSDDQVARFHEDGYLCPVPALSPAHVREYRARLEAFEASQGRSLARLPGQLRAKTHLLFPWLADLVRYPAVLAAVEDLIGPDLLVYHLTMWIKEPGDDAFVSWHQDGTYFGLEPADRHVTAWVALTDSTEETGCVTALPGSHRLGQLPHTAHRAAANLLSNGQQVEMAVDPSRVKPLVMRAGEFSLHHTHLLHSSAPNRGGDRRIGVGISYIPTLVRHAGTHRLTASLVHGRDEHGHFDPEPWPHTDFDAEARAAHADACARFFGSHGSVRTEAEAKATEAS